MVKYTNELYNLKGQFNMNCISILKNLTDPHMFNL